MNPFSRHFLPILAVLLAAAGVTGCTVRPLMAPPAGPGEATPALSSVAIAPVGTRYAQEVRNHLIFLFNGGSGTPENARYTLDLSVTRSTSAAARIQVRTENEPTAETLTMSARYRLSDSASGAQVGSGTRSITASYDVPRQEYAARRAQRDAENRAARELAEQLRLAIGQDLAQRDGRS